MSSTTRSTGPTADPGRVAIPDHAAAASPTGLWWLLGLPVAAAVLIAWQFVVQTSAEFNAAERVTGHQAVLRDLPATVVLFLPAAAGLTAGVRAARRGSRAGRVAIWLHGAGLFAVLWIAVSNLVGELRPEGSSTLEKALLPVEAAIAALVLALCLRAASRTARRRAAGARSRHARMAILVPVLALLGAAAWLAAAQAALTHHAGGFARTGVPGSVTFAARAGTTYLVYAEGNAPAGRGELDVRITGPSGASVPSRAATANAAYLLGWRGGWPLVAFTASGSGDHRVSIAANVPLADAPHAPQHPNGTAAVGDDVTTWMRVPEWSSAALLLAGALVGGVLALPSRRGRAARDPAEEGVVSDES